MNCFSVRPNILVFLGEKPRRRLEGKGSEKLDLFLVVKLENSLTLSLPGMILTSD